MPDGRLHGHRPRPRRRRCCCTTSCTGRSRCRCRPSWRPSPSPPASASSSATTRRGRRRAWTRSRRCGTSDSAIQALLADSCRAMADGLIGTSRSHSGCVVSAGGAAAVDRRGSSGTSAWCVRHYASGRDEADSALRGHIARLSPPDIADSSELPSAAIASRRPWPGKAGSSSGRCCPRPGRPRPAAVTWKLTAVKIWLMNALVSAAPAADSPAGIGGAGIRSGRRPIRHFAANARPARSIAGTRSGHFPHPGWRSRSPAGTGRRYCWYTSFCSRTLASSRP